MTTTEIKAAVARMQSKRRVVATVWQNANGTFSHHKDSQREWVDEIGCRTDLRFHEEFA